MRTKRELTIPESERPAGVLWFLRLRPILRRLRLRRRLILW